MTTIAIDLRQDTLATLASYRARHPTLSLGAEFDQFINAGYVFAATHYYYDALALTPPTGWLTFADGAYQYMSGLAMATPGAASGTFTVGTLEDYVPERFKLLYQGQLQFGYSTNSAGQILLTNMGGVISSITLQSLLPDTDAAFDTVMGNTASVMTGSVSSNNGNQFSGVVEAIDGYADAFLTSSSIKGTFNVAGNSNDIGLGSASTALTGTLSAFSQHYADGSSVQISGPLAVGGDTVLDERLLGQSAYFTGNDIISVTLPAAPPAPWLIEAGDGDDQVTILGGGSRLSVSAGTGNDTITLGDRGHAVDGGAGVDLAVFSGNRGAYTISNGAAGAVVTAVGGGADTLTGVERVKFADAFVALDISGAAGQTYRLYQAAFNRTPDSAGVGYWMKMMDAGLSQLDMARNFAASAEFKAIYGANPSNGDLVTSFYRNALHREPEPAGYAYWLDVLDRNLVSAVDLLAMFSESAENQASVATVIGNGFAYTPFG